MGRLYNLALIIKGLYGFSLWNNLPSRDQVKTFFVKTFLSKLLAVIKIISILILTFY